MTSMIAQSDALNADRLTNDEHANFWRHRTYDNLECLNARFSTHCYDMHTHDTFAVGVITAGAERFICSGRSYVAHPGQLCLVHPGEPHDGQADDDGFQYRMFYPSVRLMQERAEQLRDGRTDMPVFGGPVVDDPLLADIAVELHRRLEQSTDRLAIDQAFEQFLSTLILRQGRQIYGRDGARGRPVPADPAICKMRDYIEAAYDRDIGLDDVAKAGGLSRYQALRRFRNAIGMTPHTYLIDCRVRAARDMLAAGTQPADTAIACGFYDQSHLNRVFKRCVGITPGRYRQG